MEDENREYPDPERWNTDGSPSQGAVPEKDRGYVHVYTGDGKGKTTAALGLALRAAGYGLRTYIGQFMKRDEYGELRAVEMLQGWVTIEQYGSGTYITSREAPDEEEIRRARQGLRRARDAMRSGRYRIVVLDEVNVAIWFRLLAVEEVLALIDDKPEDVELICTGRRAPRELIDRADLVSEIREEKHYYRQGVPARRGIEK